MNASAGLTPGVDVWLNMTAFFSPLGPAIVLVAAGLLLRLLARVRRASMLALLGLGPLLLSGFLLLRLRSLGLMEFQLTWWPLVVTPLRVRWFLDGWNWLALLLLLITGASALLLTWRLPGMRAGAYHGLSLLLLGAAALTVVSDNLLTLSAAWIATDILLIARTRGGRPASGAVAHSVVAMGSLLVLLAIGITSLTAATTSFTSTVLPAETLAILLLATALRMAAYPLHLWAAPGDGDRDQGTQWLINGVGLITGAWFLGRLTPLGASYWLGSPVWLSLLALGVFSAGVAAWAGRAQGRLAMLATSRATWLWLVLALGVSGYGRDVLGWGLVAVVLGLILHIVGQSTRQVWGWRVPLVMAVATLVGVPLLAGFPARALQSLSLQGVGGVLLWFVIVMGDSLLVAAMLADWSPQASGLVSAESGQQDQDVISLGKSPRLNWPVIRLLVAFALGAIPALVWGLQPARLANLAGFDQATASGDRSLAALFSVTPLSQWLGLAATLALGFALAWTLRQPTVAFQSWRRRLSYLASLSWLPAGPGNLWQWPLDAWRAILDVLEGEGYVGWLALFFLLALLVIRA